MAYVAPSTVTTLQTYTSAAHNIIVNDIIDHETRLLVTDSFSSAWTAWTPATRSGITIGNAIETGRYVKVGRFCAINYLLQLGSTTAITGDLTIQLPFASTRQHSASAMLTDAGTLDYLGTALIISSNLIVRAVNASGTYASQSGLSATVPFTWTTNDTICVTATYETSS